MIILSLTFNGTVCLCLYCICIYRCGVWKQTIKLILFLDLLSPQFLSVTILADCKATTGEERNHSSCGLYMCMYQCHLSTWKSGHNWITGNLPSEHVRLSSLSFMPVGQAQLIPPGGASRHRWEHPPLSLKHGLGARTAVTKKNRA